MMLKQTFFSIFILLFAFGQSKKPERNPESTLKMVHVVFRHGDRTPDSLYPKDPYKEEDFYPIRIGHLTNKGKMTEYKIGLSLRSRYDSLIPELYTPEIIQSISSHYPRTKASLELVLAGLFPPAKELMWNKELLWEPIPYDYLEMSKNKLFFATSLCPRFKTAVKTSDYLENPVEAKYHDLVPFLQNETGYTLNTALEIAYDLYSTLKSEDEWGLELPSWTNEIYPDVLSELSAENWILLSEGDRKAITSGYLISRIINNTQATLAQEETRKDTKIYLYSGHDINIAALLILLDTFVPHNPNYGAHIIIEVHKISGDIYLNFFYENYQYSQPQQIKVPHCGKTCKLDTFMTLYKNYLNEEYLETVCNTSD